MEIFKRKPLEDFGRKLISSEVFLKRNNFPLDNDSSNLQKLGLNTKIVFEHQEKCHVFKTKRIVNPFKIDLYLKYNALHIFLKPDYKEI